MSADQVPRLDSAEPGLADIRAAARRISPYARRTPVLTCSHLDHLFGAELFFKCENFQKVGAFKFRGAVNAVFSLSDEEAAPGVATHSSGNHAQALALAARLRGIPAFVVMPDNAPAVKSEAVADYGAEIISCRPTLAAREEGLAKVVARTGATFIHPFDDYRIIAGQGTAALELLEEVPDLSVVTTPVGGGGLLSGTALTVSALAESCVVVAAEPSGADDAYRSWQSGVLVPQVAPHTIADGLLTSLGEKTFPIIRRIVADIVTVSDLAIMNALHLVLERMKIVIEPSAAVPVAALLTARERFPGRRIGVILSGGNVDLRRLPSLLPDDA